MKALRDLLNDYIEDKAEYGNTFVLTVPEILEEVFEDYDEEDMPDLTIYTMDPLYGATIYFSAEEAHYDRGSFYSPEEVIYDYCLEITYPDGRTKAINQREDVPGI